MYPTWEKSDHAKLNRVAKKYGRDFALSMPPKPSAGPKRKADDVIQSPREKRRHLAASVANTPRSHGPCMVSQSRVSHKAMHVEFQEPQLQQLGEDSDDHMQDCDEGQGQERSEKKDNVNDTPRDTTQNSVDVQSTSPDTTSKDRDFCVVRHSPAKRTLTRKNVEDRARDEAMSKFPDGHSASAPSPTPVEVSGLYTLITEVNVDWLPKELLTDP
jgi:hypothetical protein